MTKQELKKELKNKKIYFVSLDSSCTRFIVYFVKNGEVLPLRIDGKEDLPFYFSSKDQYFKIMVHEINRCFEIARGLYFWLYGEEGVFEFGCLN